MKRPASVLIALAALACSPVAFSQAPVTQDSTVARDLKKLRVPGKIGVVLWTRRADRLTLQVVPSDASRVVRQVARPDPGTQTFADRIQVWLLRADGTMIKPAGYATPKKGSGREAPVIEVLYSFPLSANNEAVAVAMKLDEQLLIEAVEPFPN